MRQQDITIYCKSFDTLGVTGAFDILKKMERLDDEIYYQGSYKLGAATTIRTLITKYPTYTLAKVVGPLTFIAGPPGKLDWFEGSLLTFVLDCIFWNKAVKSGTHLQTHRVI